MVQADAKQIAFCEPLALRRAEWALPETDQSQRIDHPGRDAASRRTGVQERGGTVTLKIGNRLRTQDQDG